MGKSLSLDGKIHNPPLTAQQNQALSQELGDYALGALYIRPCVQASQCGIPTFMDAELMWVENLL